MRHFLIVSFFVAIACQPVIVSAQELSDKLKVLATEREKYNSIQKQKAREYAEKNRLPLSFKDDKGNNVYLIGVDEFGLPIYRTTLNAGAAVTTGVTKLKTGGTLGLNIEGAGMVVGVWDEGLVKDHIEFGNRFVSRQGNFFGAHATHVTGTLIASGIQSAAKGMASKAKATTWDFDNDEAEMAAQAKPDQSSLLLSNHSYGIVMGFYNNGGSWAWAGNSAISSQEDYRFGFYSDKSKVIDQIAFNAPYYSIVWACGNDRTDVGDGSRPADGNGGTGYDCLGQEAVAKNNISVGAVQKVFSYTGPSSVLMSSFSSWGPADDGRIKPDLVAAGVSVYSTYVSGGVDTYSNQQGTSMAAPNVTGSLLLLQQLYKELNGGKVMKAATLKALAIHTTKEAGTDPGPDYRFGWGLLDAEAGAKVILGSDQAGNVIMENTLQNNGVFEYEFEPLQNTKVTATIVWTDPAGIPTSPQLDPNDLMLVNDLDMRVIDETNNVSLPWILNPLSPSSAANKADNFRDNVEKVEIDLAAQKKYKVRVTHKKSLVNGKQDFSLIVTFTPLAANRTTYYWIGNNGNWNDPSKWSLTTGGSPANQVPGINNRVIVDDNSFASTNQAITLTADAACYSLTWLNRKGTALSLNSNKLNVDGSLVLATDAFSVSTAGNIEFSGNASSVNQLNLNNNNLSLAKLTINSNNGSVWTINGNVNAGEIDLVKGNLIAKGVTLKLTKLNATTSATKRLDISGATINSLSESFLDSSLELLSDGAMIKVTNSFPAILDWNGITYNGTISAQGSTTITGGNLINQIDVSGTLNLNGNNVFQTFNAAAGSFIIVMEGSQQTLSENISLSATSSSPIYITSTGVNATFHFDGYYKKCFDHLNINSVDVEGEAVINAGNNSILTNSANWFAVLCNDALFSNFTCDYNCVDALTEFTDKSDGNIVSWAWDFGDAGSADNTSSEQHANHIYKTSGTYTVTLTVSDGNKMTSYNKDITVVDNSLMDNSIIVANGKLYSELTGDSYQWFKDGEIIPSANTRWYNFNGQVGMYFVVTIDNLCNKPSTPFIITGQEEYIDESEIEVSPNPTASDLNIQIPPQSLPAGITLLNGLGQVVFSSFVNEENSTIKVDDLKSGFYILSISAAKTYQRKIIVTH